MQNYHDIIIVGAGPIGLYFASRCEEKGLDYLVLEGSDSIGGQITRLYPEKLIVDITGIDSIRSSDYISVLKSKIPNNKIILNSYISSIKNGDKIEISTGNSVYFCKNLVLATGLGSSRPRPLGIEGEDKCENIIYSIKTYEYLKGKSVAIFGGGDSALDWAKTLSEISDDIHLIHRRTEFRGNSDTIKGCTNLKVHLPYIPYLLDIKDGKAVSVTIKKSNEDSFITIPVDYIFVNFGNIASLSTFPFKMSGSFLCVDSNNRIEGQIFAIGDVCEYENKTRRIAPGIKEADKVLGFLTY